MKSNRLTISYFNHTQNNNNDWTRIFHDFIYGDTFKLIDEKTKTSAIFRQTESPCFHVTNVRFFSKLYQQKYALKRNKFC